MNIDFNTRLEKLKSILGDNIKILILVSQYPDNKIIEERLNFSYHILYKYFKKITNLDYYIDNFVTKLWYRRYFINNIRKKGLKYKCNM